MVKWALLSIRDLVGLPWNLTEHSSCAILVGVQACSVAPHPVHPQSAKRPMPAMPATFHCAANI